MFQPQGQEILTDTPFDQAIFFYTALILKYAVSDQQAFAGTLDSLTATTAPGALTDVEVLELGVGVVDVAETTRVFRATLD